VVTVLLFIGFTGHNYFKRAKAEEKFGSEVSELLWTGYVNGVKAGCGALVYSIDGQRIPENISKKLFDFDQREKLCENLYYDSVLAVRKNLGLKLLNEWPKQ
jgi:hypothetical protein